MRAAIHHSSKTDGDAGLYTWDLQTDMFYADSALAELFGLDQALAERGLPVSRYLDRVVDVDRPALAGAIRHAILSGDPLQESYRVHSGNGDVVRLLDFARCFRDTEEQPRFYAGIVFPMAQEQDDGDGLMWQCMSALETAKREGRIDVAAALVQAIKRLGGGEDTVMRVRLAS